MQLKKLYERVVREGISADPRPKPMVERKLKMAKKEYEDLPKKEKAFFDADRLFNPYEDTRILNGEPEEEIKTVMVGIDIGVPELLLIDRLNAKEKKKINLAVSHHPQGRAYASFYDVMDMQADIFHSLGVPINVSEGLIRDRQQEVARKIHAANHSRALDAARLLKIPFLCMHTPADNHVVGFLQKEITRKKPQTIRDVITLLETIPEYQIAKKEHVPPRILLGRPDSRTGKIFVDMTGGTEGPKGILKHLLLAGVGTLVGMHLSEEHYRELKDKNINVIIAGHIASDNLGINLLLDKITHGSSIKVECCSGFRRVLRS